jgi:hypothetical protein
LGGPPTPRATPPPPTEPEQSDDREDEALGVALEGGTAPRIFRLLRGDPGAMEALVARLTGDDPDEQRRWKLAVAGLLEAVLADAIEQSYMRFPHEHPFWGPYTQEQNRDITRAGVGYRPDGLGGWVDDRMPSLASCPSPLVTLASIRCGCACGQTAADGPAVPRGRGRQ